MTPEQEQHLRRRLRKAVSEQPDVRRLKTLLLRLGGDFLVAPPNPDPDIPMLLESGFLTSGPIKLKVMDASSCHQNVAAIWKGRRFGIVAVATGYALSEDGLWRQHSWGILRDGVLETTLGRVKYFGIILQGAAANHFAKHNSPS